MLKIFLNSYAKNLAILLQSYHETFNRIGDSDDYSRAHQEVLEYGRKLINKGGKELMNEVYNMISKGEFPGAKQSDIRLLKKHLERSWDSFGDWKL